MLRTAGERHDVARGKIVTIDDYDCRICGYKAADVRGLSQHLHTSHPVTALPGPSSLNGETRRGKKEEVVQVTCVDQRSEGQRSPPAGKTVLSEGATFSLFKHLEKSRHTCTVENQVPETEHVETVKKITATKASKSSSPASILPQRKASSSSGSTNGNQSEDSASSGTAGLNRTPLVCLPLVSEGLKLVWVRSEQTRELDDVSELVEAFNAFPYPTEQEASALARRCSLQPDRVKVWFMMQRVRYGISWADADIHQTRLRLRRLHGGPAGDGLEEKDKEDELRDFLMHENTRQEEPHRGFKQATTRESYMGHTPHAVVHGNGLLQHCASDYSSSPLIQYGANNQYTNGLEQPLKCRAEAQHTSAFEHSSSHRIPPHPHNDMNHLPPGEAEFQSPVVYTCPPQPSTDRYRSSTAEYTALMYPPRTEPGCAPTVQLRKKSKAQLMVLRRSFVHRNWPTEAEVQRLQRVTGLSRHEIRKWFADSRYQLRRSGRGWSAGDGRRSRPQQLLGRFRRRLDTGSLYEANEAVGSGAGFELDLDEHMEGKQGPLVEGVSRTDTGKEQECDDLDLGDGHTSIKQEQQEIDIDLSVDPSPSPSSSSPSPSFLQGQAPSAGPEPYLRKKTQEQLDVLRQSFLRCQWPSSNDYTVLQRKTGLTRTEIVQWFGDTRYHIKHSNMRWMSPENRERIIAGLTKQQRRGGRSGQSRAWRERADARLSLGASQASNGTGESEERTWDGLYRLRPSGLACGDL
ncbi:homeobox and leucine zipper encoding b [Electrophorus electricus]|uniref:Homeobox domain-containing protein n=1 Tax=Electrophorus electricus TaxID=8005 RepID=A0A4W4EIP0_ELEEL|nr:homeobox and leucine zipper encoding b [Electrophorus electricus]